MNIALDVGSAGIYVLDDLTYEMLDFITIPMNKKCSDLIFSRFKDFDREDVQETYSQIYGLYKNGRLFSDEIDYEKFDNLVQNAKIKAMCLHVAHDCNLRCAYCFASTGNFGGARQLMDFETAKAAIDFLIKNSGERKNLEVDFFGGEPLMNFDVVKRIIYYARTLEKKFNKNFRFTVTTNGTLLDDSIIDFINNEMSNVVLSLDGKKTVNDKIRKMADGKSSSYDAAMPKFKKLVKNRTKTFKDYYIRGTFTNKNLNFVDDVLHFYENGFDQISVEPVVSSLEKDYALRHEHLPKIFEQYEILAKKIIQMKQNSSKINFFHFMIDLNQGPCIIKRLRGCGCGTEYLAVDPVGEIYPCHQFVGNEKFKMGNVFSGINNQNLVNLFSKANLINKKECQNCWAKFFCSGGCNANNFNFEGSVFIPYEFSCVVERKRIECAIAIKAAILCENSNMAKTN